MTGRVLLSTAYLPPAEYFFRIALADVAMIEREENYIKQTYRNRCYIIASSGPQVLTVPVCLGSFHKTPIKEIKIDYSKRWQQVHLGSLMAAYRSSPYYIYYHEEIEKIILKGHKFLLDLNMELLEALLGMIKLNTRISFTSRYVNKGDQPDDFRYVISPKKISTYEPIPYRKVFNESNYIAGRLSIIDLLFNTGPDGINHLNPGSVPFKEK